MPSRKLTNQAAVVLPASGVAAQKPSLGVSGNAAASIAGLALLSSMIDCSSLMLGSRQPPPASGKLSHASLACAHVTCWAELLRCQVSPVDESFTVPESEAS